MLLPLYVLACAVEVCDDADHEQEQAPAGQLAQVDLGQIVEDRSHFNIVGIAVVRSGLRRRAPERSACYDGRVGTVALSSGLSGIAGEYFVAAELTRRGLIAALTLKNTKGIDILVSDHLGRTAGVQVKTNKDGSKGWLVGAKDLDSANPSLFYVFVNLNGLGSPEFHVVPSVEVVLAADRHHAKFMERWKRDGTQNKDVGLREFQDRERAFKDAWHLLGFESLRPPSEVTS